MSIQRAKENGINPKTYCDRIRRGWPEELAATKPPKSQYAQKEPKKPYTVKERAYICYFYEKDGKHVGHAFGRTPKAIETEIYKLRKKGLFDHYKQMWEAIG